MELAAARVLELLRDGVEPGDVAVVFRDPGRYSSLLEQVFGAYGIPYSIDRTLPFGHTGLGRGLLAMIRSRASDRHGGGPARLPAHPGPPARAGLRGQPRSRGAARGRAPRDGRARALWERDRWPLEELDRLARARTRRRFVSELESRLTRLFAAPYERSGNRPERAAARRRRARSTPQRSALAELRSVLGGRPADASHVLRVLEQLEVRVGETPQPDRVHVATPEAIRARRFEVVFACGLQEGEFPRGASPEPFLSDEDRRSIASASGLLLPVREDRLDRERYLFYICASRAERLLVLSSRSSDEEGNPQTESYFVDDVRELLEDGAELRKRSLSEVTWRPEDAPNLGGVGPRPRGHRSAPAGAATAPAQRRAAARRSCPPATQSRPARSRTSPTAP